jgi:hypothetical protein
MEYVDYHHHFPRLPPWSYPAPMAQQHLVYIERLLRKQLVVAIGKKVQQADFDQFICYNYRKLFLLSTPQAILLRHPTAPSLSCHILSIKKRW